MGDIYSAFNGLFGHEGVYDNDPDDPGGETVYGVARKHWPNLPLWARVDRIRGNETNKKIIAKKISEDPFLMKEIQLFYKKEFWDIFSCDLLPQPLAYEIFEQSVNVGRKQCSLHIQRAVNILNRDGTLWPDVAEDGVFGKGTLAALISASKNDTKYLVGILNVLQGAFYVSLKKEKFIRGWITRAQWVYK